MYFNWVGAVKVPAPCYNVMKLVNFHGERYDSLKVSQALLDKNCQYFI
jgi:hypothetical protein